MAYHQSNENRVRVYDASSIPLRGVAFAQAVDLTQIMRLNHGASADTASTGFPTSGDGNAPNVIYGQPQFSAQELNPVHFAPDGRFYEGLDGMRHAGDAKGMQGFTLVPREDYLDCVMSPGQPGDVTASVGYDSLHWQGVSGDPTQWRTVGSPDRPHARRIAHLKQMPGQVIEAQTLEPLPADCSIRADIGFMGVAQGHGPGAYFALAWADKTYRLVLYENKYASLERWRSDPNWNSGVPGWAPWRVLTNAPKIHMHGARGTTQPLVLTVRLIGGYIVFGFNDFMVWIADTSARPAVTGTPPDANQDPIINEISWPAGKLNVEMYGVQATVGIAPIVYRKLTGDLYPGATLQGVSGTFTQSIFTPFAPPGGTPVSGDGKGAGWLRKGTSCAISSTWNVNAKGGQIDTVVTLTTDTDTSVGSSPGIHTPLLLRYVAQSNNSLGASGSYIDITPYINGHGHVSGATLPDTAMTTATIDGIDRLLLTQNIPTWQSYVADFHYMTWEQRWRLSDGTYTAWTMLFQGYIGMDAGTTQVNEQELSLRLSGPMMFLQEPYGLIDNRFLPLDWLMMNSGKPLYDAAAVRYILTMILGQTVGDAMNGGVDQDLRFCPPDMYALIDGSNDTGGLVPSLDTITLQPPSADGWRYPPPFWKAALEWINTIREKGCNVLTYLTLPGASAPCFVYGRQDLIEAAMATAGVIELQDASYDTNSIDELISGAHTYSLPGTSYNQCIVTFGPGVQQMTTGILDQSLVTVSRLPDSDPYNSPATTGTRTKEFECEWIYDRDTAQRFGDAFIALFANRPHRTGNIEARGRADASFGRQVAVRMSGSMSDTTLGLNAYPSGSLDTTKQLRCWHCDHDVDFARREPTKDFMTQFYCTPLPGS